MTEIVISPAVFIQEVSPEKYLELTGKEKFVSKKIEHLSNRKQTRRVRKQIRRLLKSAGLPLPLVPTMENGPTDVEWFTSEKVANIEDYPALALARDFFAAGGTQMYFDKVQES